jgi:creatinine amidohydrolase
VAATGRSSVLVLPVGSLEQHGPHLPLDTDSRIATALAGALAARRPAVVVGPALAYGASGEHAGFPGTLSVDHAVVTATVLELVRSARASFAGVIVVSGHGGNAAALAKAATRSRFEGDQVLVWSPVVPGGDAHAGRTETSMVLALDPGAVDLAAARAGPDEPLETLLGRLRVEGVRAVSANGVLGDPTGATADEGRALLADLTDDLVRRVDEWWPSTAAAAR